MRNTWKPLTFLLALTILFLFSGSVYGDDFKDGKDEVYFCAETGSTGYSYDEKRGRHYPDTNALSRFKMKLDRASRVMELAFDGLPPDAPIELTRPKYNCRNLQGFPELFSCQKGLFHFDFNIENGKYVRSQSVSIKFPTFGIYIGYGKCDKF